MLKMLSLQHKLTIVLISFVGIFVSGYTALNFYQIESKNIKALFEEDINREIYLLDKEIRVNMEVLYTLKSLYEGSREVTLEEFRSVSRSILARHKDIQALQWVPKVKRSERKSYEERMREIYPDFEVTERDEQGNMVSAKEKDIYYFVYYTEPYAGNELALGFDNASNEKRLKTLEHARDTGEFVATGKVSLVQSQDTESAYIIFVPVYHGNPTTITARRDKLHGFVVAVFRVGYIFEKSISQSVFKNIGIRLIDITNADQIQEFYNRPLAEDEPASKSYTVRKAVPPLAGRKWLVEATPSVRYVASHRSWIPFIIFVAGSFFTLLGAGYAFMILRRGALIEETVLKRTEELQKAKTELEALARVDGLTGLANKRFFNEYYEREWLRAIREKSPISLIMVDIDFFKQYNDHYGHVAGDRCLKKIAETLRICIHRPADIIARFGGEEFVLLLPNTEDATPVARNCLMAVENMQIAHEFSSAAKVVTISIGVSTMVPDRDNDMKQLVQRADNALYEAKKNGRNRIEMATR